MVELDREMIEGLKSIGFKHDMGEDDTGHQVKYYTRGGGYNLDAGSSALMIKGEIGLLQFDRIERFVAEGARLKDGSIVPADLIVLSTGYYPQVELVRRALGEAMVERIGPVWGFGPDGELSNMYKRGARAGLAWGKLCSAARPPRGRVRAHRLGQKQPHVGSVPHPGTFRGDGVDRWRGRGDYRAR